MFFSSLLLAASITVTAGGDAFMVQGFPKGFKLDKMLTEWIGSGDARLVNFETVVNDGTCRPAAWSGGTWSSMDPSVLPDFLAFGFNGCGCANNHSLDYSKEGLFMTMAALDKAGIPYVKVIADEEPTLTEQYGVRQAPTLVITSSDGFDKIVNVSNIKKFAEDNG